ncbi:unnamed protein product [Caenorhabditis sp. 36 PRJEB53466]|nr:unnamed protein product [Caenorhabditis sp. 36 PRJEB53466]
MRYYILITVLITEVLTETEHEFVPIGKDTAPHTINVTLERPLPKSVGSTVVSHKVFTEDGIKYTEIVRKTPSGGTQVAHIKGDVRPSLLPVPVPDLSGLMRRLQTTIAARLEMPAHPLPNDSFFTRAVVSVTPTAAVEDPIYPQNSGFAPPTVVPFPPPAYPPMMMYPPAPYSLLGRVESMTGNILDNVMEFVMGRRR